MKRKVFTTIIAGVLLSSLSFGYSGGDGTSGNPYQIATKADLLALATTTADYGKCFILTADIDLDPNLPGGQVFTTAIIAKDTSSSSGFQGTAFTGVFDGNGHKITRFTINGGSNDYLGLFGKISFTSSSAVNNLGLENFSVSGSSGSYYIGSLVGDNRGSINNCYSMGTVSGYYNVGGLVGYLGAGGNIVNCYSTATITGSSGSSRIGGLVGYSLNTITNCYNTGTINGSSRVGGLVGFGGGGGGDITFCYNAGDVHASATEGDEDADVRLCDHRLLGFARLFLGCFGCFL